MTALLFNLAALAAAPFVHRLSGRAPALEAGLDACLRALVFGLVAGEVLPHGLVLAGWPTLVAAAFGAVSSLFVERYPGVVGRVGVAGDRTRLAVGLVLVIAALSAHSFVDGVGLASAGAAGALSVAIVLHALPLGLIVWHGLTPRYGAAAAALALAAAGLSTTVGFFVPAEISTPTPVTQALLGVLPSLVAGSLLHAIAHPWKEGLEVGSGRWSSGLGAVVGGALAVFLVLREPVPSIHASELDISDAVAAVLALGAPALVIGTVVAVLAGSVSRTSAAAFAWAPGAVLVGALLGPWVGMVTLVIGAMASSAVHQEGASRPLPALLRDTLDPLLPWWLLGTAVAAVLEPWLPPGQAIGGVPAVVVALALAWAFPADLVAIAPVAAVLVHKGLPLPAAAAWIGAVTVHRAVRRPWVATLVGVSSAAIVGFSGWAGAPALHAVTPERPFSLVSVCVLLALVGWSLLRLGLTGFLAPVLHPVSALRDDLGAARG